MSGEEKILYSDGDTRLYEYSDNGDGWNSRRRTRKRNGMWLILHIILLFLNVICLLCNVTTFSSRQWLGIGDFSRAWSPADAEVGYTISEEGVSEAAFTSPFIGEPRPELDHAWSDLLSPMHIRVTEEEMRRMNKTSITLRDGNGYVGYPEVLHMLHCVKRFKQYRHLDHYSDLKQSTFELPHWDHCIEVLRRGIMCNADLSIDTVVWNGDDIHGVSDHPRKCRDWSSFQEWLKPRGLVTDERNPGKTLYLKDEPGGIGPT